MKTFKEGALFALGAVSAAQELETIRNSGELGAPGKEQAEGAGSGEESHPRPTSSLYLFGPALLHPGSYALLSGKRSSHLLGQGSDHSIHQEMITQGPRGSPSPLGDAASW